MTSSISNVSNVSNVSLVVKSYVEKEEVKAAERAAANIKQKESRIMATLNSFNAKMRKESEAQSLLSALRTLGANIVESADMCGDVMYVISLSGYVVGEVYRNWETGWYCLIAGKQLPSKAQQHATRRAERDKNRAFMERLVINGLPKSPLRRRTPQWQRDE